MKTFERITFNKNVVTGTGDATRQMRPIFISITRETPTLLFGIEVDKDGDELSGATWDRRMRIVSKDVIAKRVPYVLDKMYAMLVKKGTETK